MDREDTKQRILLCALDLFSQYGYEAVSVEQIASAVGIKAPSLYKHYKGKQAIFDAVFLQMSQRYDAQIESMNMHLENADKDYAMFDTITVDVLAQKVRELVAYSLHDDYVSKFRKLLTIEQFRKREFAELYTKRYVDFMMEYHIALFDQLVKYGKLKNEDTQIMALEYVSPICVLLGVCDREPERESEMMEILERHVRQFERIYGKR